MTRKRELAYRAVVRKAANILDTICPGWWKRVDLNRLDTNDGQHCVLGQVFAGRRPTKKDPTPFLYGYTQMRKHGYRGVRASAFAGKTQEDGWVLDGCWFREVRTRPRGTR